MAQNTPVQLVIPQLKRPINLDDDGEHFEQFCKSFCQAKYGTSFRPVGGKKDGGLDGVYVNPEKTTRIYQFSVQEKVAQKIEKTFDRLKEHLLLKYDNFKELYYVTNRTVKNPEELEERLESQYGKRLKIMDIAWIMTNLRSEDGTLQVASDYYYTENKPLYDIAIHPQVYVFFSLMTSGSDSIIDYSQDLRSRALDALILQALKDTSTENRMKRTRLVSILTNTHPWVKERLIDACLKRLNQKHSKKVDVRLINIFRKEDELCLPYDTVCEVRDRRNESVALCDYVAVKVKEFLSEVDSKANESERVWTIVQSFLASVFSTRGTQMLDWAESKKYVMGSADIELLSETLKGRGIRDPRVHKIYQYILSRLLGSRDDEKVVSFLVRLNESYLLHLISGRDVKIHAVLDHMRRGLTLVCCSSIIIPQFADYLRTEEPTLLKRATLTGIKIRITEPYLEEVKNHLRESLNYDQGGGGAITTIAVVAIEKRTTVKELLSDLGLVVPSFANLLSVLRELLGVELLDGLETRSAEITRVATALKPHRENRPAAALADASVLFYIMREQSRSKGHYCTWWLTRETMTVKVAISLKIQVDDRVYMRLSFLQDMLLLPGRDDIETTLTPTWAQDTLLLSTPTDAFPNDLMEPYRKARKKFESTSSEITRIKTLSMMNSFMTLGALTDRNEEV